MSNKPHTRQLVSKKIVPSSNLTPIKNETNPADKFRLVSKVGVNANSLPSENGQKVRKTTVFLSKTVVSCGCGGRTRTYDLRVMSPTSFQLLYSAIFMRSLDCLGIITQAHPLVNPIFCYLLSAISPALPVPVFLILTFIMPKLY